MPDATILKKRVGYHCQEPQDYNSDNSDGGFEHFGDDNSVVTSQGSDACDTMIPCWEDLDRMTLQIGLVGSDGIVLASDRLVNVSEAGDFTLSIRSKFFSTDAMACCWSGDSVARYAAMHISQCDWSSPLDRRKTLRDCGDRAWNFVHGSFQHVPKAQISPRKVLVAFSSDASLWELDLSQMSIADVVIDKTVAGSARTTIKHLINNYVPRERLPIANLVLIAAHSILMGHQEQNADIDGLEIAIIRRGENPQFLTKDQENTLEYLSAELHASLSKQLLQEFELQPRRAESH